MSVILIGCNVLHFVGGLYVQTTLVANKLKGKREVKKRLCLVCELPYDKQDLSSPTLGLRLGICVATAVGKMMTEWIDTYTGLGEM
jgi:hypothetical protein